jgi:hypothetical protein
LCIEKLYHGLMGGKAKAGIFVENRHQFRAHDIAIDDRHHCEPVVMGWNVQDGSNGLGDQLSGEAHQCAFKGREQPIPS